MTNEQELEIERREALLRHIQNVQDSCNLLGTRLIKSGEEKIGHKLMANGMIHDASKWRGIEWKYLHRDVVGTEDEAKFKLAWEQHVLTNEHHPEFWNEGVHEMPRLYRAEMVCDWSARSKEMGTDLMEWIKNEATKKYEMPVQSKAYKDIKKLTELLLDPTFMKVK